jgi:GTPase SAR1 family protein
MPRASAMIKPLIKIIIIGDLGVGKTTLALNFTEAKNPQKILDVGKDQ